MTSDSGLSGGAVVSSATTMVPEVDFREIEMEDQDKVAQGGLGVLYKGTWRGCAVAVKRPVDPRAVMDADLKEDFRREAAILSEVRHPNVVLLLGASLQGANLCLVLEWCNGGNLHELIHHPRDAPLAKIEKVGLLAGLAAAVAWLHTSSPAIIHRDIKPANVLVDGTRTVAKLCDFGLAIRNSEVASTRSDAGTPQYMAPELYRGECCSLESDVYAIGASLPAQVCHWRSPLKHSRPRRYEPLGSTGGGVPIRWHGADGHKGGCHRRQPTRCANHSAALPAGSLQSLHRGCCERPSYGPRCSWQAA